MRIQFIARHTASTAKLTLSPIKTSQFLGYPRTCKNFTPFSPFKNLGNSVFFKPFCSSVHQKSSFSTSSSLNQKMGFLSWYLRMLDVRPIITKSVSAALIYGASDLTAQTMTMENSVSFDWGRTLRMAAFGLLFLGPTQHMWFNFLARILPKRDMVTTFKKLIMGQLFYGPSCIAAFFTYNAYMQGESGSEIALRLKRDLVPTLKSGLMYWPVCDFFTYKIIPVHLQPLMNSSFSYLWTIYLTYMASLEKAVDD